ncbi:hypothetical protein EVG20_g8717, partial [Dentipellis fragilis]
MPAQSTFSPDDKAKIKSSLPKASNKILTAALVRVYYAYPSPSAWSYAGLQGALAFVADKSKNAYFLRLVDLTGTRGVVWEHELWEGFEYNQDRPYFHSFAGDECMIGIVFADEGEAKTLHKKVTARKDLASGSTKAKKYGTSKPTTKKKSGSHIDKSLISGPTQGSFKHLGHMGYDQDHGFTSTGVDPSWGAFLTNLESHGIDSGTIAENMDFIKGFVRDAQKSSAAAPAAGGGGEKKR